MIRTDKQQVPQKSIRHHSRANAHAEKQGRQLLPKQELNEKNITYGTVSQQRMINPSIHYSLKPTRERGGGGGDGAHGGGAGFASGNSPVDI